jgi:serine/threonine protein kinase
VFLGSHDNVKLGDFGLSKVLDNDSLYAYTNVGTPYYMSPEQINEDKYNHKSDIWSLGCIIYETCALKPPFQAENYLSLAMKIKDGKINRIPKQYSDDLQNIIKSMLSIDQDQRPSIQELVANTPRINIKVREIKVKDMIAEYHKREEILSQKEKKFIGKINYF